MKANKLVLLAFLSFSIFNSPIGATEPSTKISGFLTAGAAYSDNETDYFRAGITDDQPNYEQDTVLGIQVDTALDSATRFSAQFIASNKEGTSFDTNAEWLYVSRNLGSYTTARIGRLRLPAFMYSQQIFAGGSYLWLRPPQEVYNLLVSITNFTGGDIILNLDSDIGTASLQLYTGQVIDKPLIILGNQATISTDQLVGAVARFNTENLGLFFSYSKLDTTTPISIAPLPPTEISSDLSIATLGLNYNIGDFEIISEHAQTFDTELETRSWYATLAYHAGSWTPYLTLAQADSRALDPTSGIGLIATAFSLPPQAFLFDSESITLGVRKDLSPKVSVNAELHRGEAKHGAKGLFSAYNPAPTLPLEQNDPDINMVSFAVNVLF